MKLGTKIFTYNLSPAQLQVYMAIADLAGKRGTVVLKAATIAQRAGVSVRTVYREVPVLCAKSLIGRAHRYIKDINTGKIRQSASRYTVHSLPGAFICINLSKIIRAGAGASALYCYAFLQKCANRHGKAFPSFTKIADATGLCRSTVIKAMAELAELGLLIKSQYTKLCGCFGCNNYTLGKTVEKADKKIHTAALTTMCIPVTSKITLKDIFGSIVQRAKDICQGLFSFFRKKGSANLAQQRLYPLKDVQLR